MCDSAAMLHFLVKSFFCLQNTHHEMMEGTLYSILKRDFGCEAFMAKCTTQVTHTEI